MPRERQRCEAVNSFYTLLLRSNSFYVDAETRERILRAQRLRAPDVRITPVRHCTACSSPQSVLIALRDVQGFIAHDRLHAESYERDNVVELRAFG